MFAPSADERWCILSPVLAGVGPVTPEAILLVLAMLAAIAAVGVAWALAVLISTLAEAVAITWLFVRLLPKSWRERWLLKPLLTSLVLGVALPLALLLNASAIGGDGAVVWLPALVGLPFGVLLVVLALVEMVRAWRWLGERRRVERARLADSKVAAVAGVGFSVGKLTLAKLLRVFGILVSAAGFALVTLLVAAMLHSGADTLVVGAVLMCMALSISLAVVPWYLARSGGRLAPRNEAAP